MQDTHVEHSISVSINKKKKTSKTTIDGNMAALQHTITERSEI